MQDTKEQGHSMPEFIAISSDAPIKEVIQSAFDTELALSGGWGYTK